SEHTEFRWCNATEASELLKYDSNRIALWELSERLKAHQMKN
nr:NUDIX pyrophosphatase [Vibrio anguillarum]